jgi:hypothetical protein
MHYFKLVAVLAGVLTFTASASAQQTPPKLEIGQWTGKVTPPEGGTVDVLYDVAYAGDTLKITIRAAEHGTFATTEVKLEGTKLSFKFRPGPEVVCVLEKKEAIFAGVCTEDNGETATMEMSPPKKEGN